MNTQEINISFSKDSRQDRSGKMGMRKRMILVLLGALVVWVVMAGNALAFGVPPASGAGTLGSPYEIATWQNLYWISQDSDRWDKYYLQTANIDFADAGPTIDTWDGGAGWTPIGNSVTNFTGTYNGNDHTITGLYINRPLGNSQGMFGVIGSVGQVENLGLLNVDITGNQYVGGLTSYNQGTINNCYTTGSVVGAIANTGTRVGGLVGWNGPVMGGASDATIINSYSECVVSGKASVGGLAGGHRGDDAIIRDSYSTGDVTGTNNDVGGLVGHNQATIDNCYSTGIVNGTTGASSVGGLVGQNDNFPAPATITNSYSTGDVTGTGARVGGLVGNNRGTISNSNSTGVVIGESDYVGGLVGRSWQDGNISNCYSTGAVTGTGSNVGGLVGGNDRGTISKCYSTGDVIGDDKAGGLVGNNEGGTVSNSYTTGAVNGTNQIGGLVGSNYHYFDCPCCPFERIGTVSNSYTTGLVTGTGIDIGGLVGHNSVDGQGSGNVSDSFWDTETSGQSDSDGGIGKTTAEMKSYETFFAASWSFPPTADPDWHIDESASNPDNDGYPSLAWQLLAHIVNPNTYAVTYDGNNNTGGSVPVDGNNYLEGATVTVSDNTGNLVRTGHTFAGWNTQSDGQGTSYNAADTFSMGSAYVTLYAKWTAVPDQPSNGGASPSPEPAPAPAPPPPPAPGLFDVIIDGERHEPAGTAREETVGGQTHTTVTLDQGRVDDILAQISAPAPGEKAPVITVPVSGAPANLVSELNGRMVRDMEAKEVTLEIKTEQVTYTLPAKQIDITAVSSALGQTLTLEEIKVSIEIRTPPAETVQVITDTLNRGGLTLVAPPLQFNIICTYGDKTVAVTSFNNYVERTIAVPAGVDPNRITTGVVVEPDGSVRHVPTRITVIGGRYYAVINSLTNSTYSVIWNQKEFKDTLNHWASEAVNDMASRLVISGTGNDLFEPDRPITRAEFAAILVRALGLRPDHGSNPFDDLDTAVWSRPYITAAYAYALIAGYGDGTFGPEDQITREQAMVMLARAMGLTGIQSSITKEQADTLLGAFSDAGDAAAWAKEGIAACVHAGLVSGRGGAKLAPKAQITRAETATMIMRLLQQSELI